MCVSPFDWLARRLVSLTQICSAKHLESSGEQLTTLAGSFGYVAPEVLNHKGHGKPVDLWSIGYLLLPSSRSLPVYTCQTESLPTFFFADTLPSGQTT